MDWGQALADANRQGLTYESLKQVDDLFQRCVIIAAAGDLRKLEQCSFSEFGDHAFRQRDSSAVAKAYDGSRAGSAVHHADTATRLQSPLASGHDISRHQHEQRTSEQMKAAARDATAITSYLQTLAVSCGGGCPAKGSLLSQRCRKLPSCL
jgi:hypothetical protein